jgi:hypothetical protein
MANARSYTAGRFLLDLNKEAAGYVKSVSGGQVRGEVAVHQLGPDNVQKKNLATILYEPFTVEVGMGMTRGFWEWIESSFKKEYRPMNGEVVAADFDYKAMSARVFTDALISEVTIPALDGSSKEAAYMTIKFDPEKITYEKRGGEVLSGKIAPATKKWLCSNWKFDLSGLPCERVAKIDSFTWKQAVIKDECGMFRSPTKHPAKVEVPNLKLTVSMADSAAWADWHRTFVIEGKCADSDERNGSVTFLGPDLQEELAMIEFDHVGIISMQEAKKEANKEEVARFEVELYVEEMRFTNYTGADM